MNYVYSSGNSTEAHMIMHMLGMNNIEAQVHGEYLQGAIGELPASGNIKVSVEPVAQWV